MINKQLNIYHRNNPKKLYSRVLGHWETKNKKYLLLCLHDENSYFWQLSTPNKIITTNTYKQLDKKIPTRF